uniref:Small ribosomal subunit protein uS2c n=1 Tax=Ishige okamurae TaxID=233772 RepID=A0A8E5XRD1_9PHAE|nr:ribosomal protein S2 [Ishige okamurae]QVJ99582.1 ribosomal protein S2 [Ishige okamurae]
MAKIELAQLLEAGVHFGHKAKRWNPKMFPHIYAERNGIHILDLIQTAQLLKVACDFSTKIAKNNKTFLFIGTKRQAAAVIAHASQRCGAFYVNHRWLGGMLTNWTTIKRRIERLKELEVQEKIDDFAAFPKKEAAGLKNELRKLQKHFNGVKEMEELPDVVIIIDQKREITAVKEAQSLNIPIITILDTNCDPSLTTLGIPANDDAVKSIKYIIDTLVDSICLGQQNILKY